MLKSHHLTILKVRLKKLENEVYDFLLGKCPKCGSETKKYGNEYFCIKCTMEKLSNRSIKNSIAKAKQMKQVYIFHIACKKKPGAPVESLQTLIPSCLDDVNIHEELKKINSKSSSLSAAQREFVVLYVWIESLYSTAMKVGTKYNSGMTHMSKDGDSVEPDSETVEESTESANV